MKLKVTVYSEMSSILSFQSFLLVFITVIIGESLAQNATDADALKAFKSNIIHDPQGVLNSWNDSIHFCEWKGIRCSPRHRRVTVLDLRSRGLRGTLSPYIGNLTFLRRIFLFNNSIQGQIPHELGRLSRLEVLYLYNNSLVGEIPPNLSNCSRMTNLFLGRNHLVGKIPPELGSLYNLNELALHKNNLTGVIPPSIGNLTSLEYLSIAYNALDGNIPNSLGQLKRLLVLGIGANNLSGTVPPALYNLSFLQTFSLPRNQLHGSIPSNLPHSLPQLKYLQMSDNFFVGKIPMSLSNASKLEVLELSGNRFFGKLSIDFRGMQHLAKLIVDSNHLGSGEADEMSFINSLVNCSNFRGLVISRNQFKGPFPQSIANLSTTLKFLDLGENRLYGSIPLGITNLVNLIYISMERNQFTGPIPREMGKLQKLLMLNLGYNHLSGEIPSSLGNLSLLSNLYLENNDLSGRIPSSLENLKQLSILNLSQNELSGIIPKQIFNITYLSVSLNLAQNRLVGSIPPDIKNLKVLTEFDVSDNSLSGKIPNEIGFSTSLEYLYMEGNFFNGSIPSSLSSLKGLRKLDFSRNNLSGQIPKFLETFSLEKLNLSFNDLEGEVPIKGIFANASAISVFGNNNRLCGGITELQLPKCPNHDSKKENISSALKIIISIASAVSGLTMMLFFIFYCLKNRREKQKCRSTMEKTLLKVSYERLLQATNGFASTNLIGSGSFGSVYKGILDQDETIVAVKVLNLQRQGASKSFLAECKALRNIRHRNLVKVVTSCSSIDYQGNDFKAIIYEFMVNGSLEKWLHPALESGIEQLEVQSLTLLQRIRVAIDVASALDYLHHHCQESILHCDLKPSNVLLDSEMTAHVGDFGLAMFLSETSKPNQSSSIGVKGTIGYAAPEYGLGSKVSKSGDVYSYGILLLEMMTGKKPTNIMFVGDFNLHNFARTALPERVMDIVDPVLINEEIATLNDRMRQEISNNRIDCLASLIRIGVACSVESPQERMNITNVIDELHSIKNILQPSTTNFNRSRGL